MKMYVDGDINIFVMENLALFLKGRKRIVKIRMAGAREIAHW